MDLFNPPTNLPPTDSQPGLSPHALRPLTWDEILGQDHLFSPGSPLRRSIENKTMRSLIAWGPPGTGKTSFSKLLTASFAPRPHVALIATETGVGEIKKIISDYTHLGNKLLLVIDEFHRFTKLQQDTFLRPVEEEQILLVGMTTQNPKYFLDRALLSRLDIFEFKKLPTDALEALLIRSWARRQGASPFKKTPASDELLSSIIAISDGDARMALMALFRVLDLHPQVADFDVETVKKILHELELDKPKKSLDPELHYRWISDYIKAMRSGNENEALTKLKALIDQGEDPLFIGRRLIIFAAEDVGLASPALQPYVQSLYEGVKAVGLPEGRILLTAATLACLRAKKSREAFNKAY